MTDTEVVYCHIYYFCSLIASPTAMTVVNLSDLPTPKTKNNLGEKKLKRKEGDVPSCTAHEINTKSKWWMKLNAVVTVAKQYQTYLVNWTRCAQRQWILNTNCS